jgi:hypothetical protein
MYVGFGPHELPGLPLKGATYVLTGNIYRADFLEDHCPENNNCGIVLVLTQDTVYTLPEFPNDAILGQWNVRGFVSRNYSEGLDEGGSLTYSTQTFSFSDDFTPCPGCTIVTEGKDFYGGDVNAAFKKAIVGGTTEEYRLMRGEAEQIIYKQPENENKTGAFNFAVTFQFDKD